MILIVKHSQTRNNRWYIVAEDEYKYYLTTFFPCLHEDLTIHPGTAYHNADYDREAGYYKTKTHAEATLRAYELLQVAKRSKMMFKIRQSVYNPNRGWYIIRTDNLIEIGRKMPEFIHKNLELHTGTGFDAEIHDDTYPGQAPGYYRCEYDANETLKRFLEKHNMVEKIEINVKLNGVDTPLHEISEQTLLNLREASKPKPVPVFQIAECGSHLRFIFKMTEMLATRIGQYVALQENGEIAASFRTLTELDNYYDSRRELRLDEV